MPSFANTTIFSNKLNHKFRKVETEFLNFLWDSTISIISTKIKLFSFSKV